MKSEEFDNFAPMENQNKPELYFAPLQEATDFVYRRAHATIIGGVDKYFAPYIIQQNDGSIKRSHRRDVEPENCTGYRLVPQIMAANAEQFLLLAQLLEELGYREINWNIGCPYPMVTRRNQGAGLLPHPDTIKEILDRCLPLLKSKLTVKMRTGLEEREEILPLIPLLNSYPLGEVIVHPRIGKQLYKGVADRDYFATWYREFTAPVVYNGDIDSPEDLNRCRELFPGVERWMIGRALLADPFLGLKIKGAPLPGRKQQGEMLYRFHDEVYHQYSQLLSGSSHLLMRMTKFWSYFSGSFPDPAKAFKRIKKSSNLAKYDQAVRENFHLLSHEED